MVRFPRETYGFSDEFTDYVKTVPIVPDRGSAIGRALLEGGGAYSGRAGGS